ncbi:MAG TPA: helix-turn-helix domain-containing protein [Bacteroidia bacterium]|jgi:DNA-binding HxlR family transcriptional regulator
MANKKSYQECQGDILPIRDALEIINGKWKILILISITHGNKRFTEIERSIPKITGKVLAKQLKELEMNDLIKRTVYDSTPVSIEYEPTSYAALLHPVINALKEWGQNHRRRIISRSKKK